MTEKIKEILNNLRYTAKEHTIQVLENSGMIESCPQQIPTEMRLNSYSAKILLDYITNLQQENEKLNNIINTFEEYLRDLYHSFDYEAYESKILDKVLDELKELKESGNNE